MTETLACSVFRVWRSELSKMSVCLPGHSLTRTHARALTSLFWSGVFGQVVGQHTFLLWCKFFL